MLMFFLSLRSRLAVKYLVFLLAGAASLFMQTAQASSLSWGSVHTGVYDPTYARNISDELHPITADTGGFDLSTGAYTSDPSRADFVITYLSKLGAAGVQLLDESLEINSTSDPGRYENTIRLHAGGVYLVVMHDGRIAKIRINTLTPSKVYFSYRLQASVSQPTNTVTYLITCDRAQYPSGVSCGEPMSLGAVLAFTETDRIFRQDFACNALGADAYWCGTNSLLEPGYLLLYRFTDGTVSRIIYLR